MRRAPRVSHRNLGLLILFFIFGLTILSNWNDSTEQLRDEVSIVIYWPTTWHGLDSDEFKLPNYLGTHVTRDKCSVECKISVDQQHALDADALIFDASATGKHDNIYHFPPPMPSKFSHQQWILFSYEQDAYFPIQSEEVFLASIDVNATWDHKNSQVPVSFICPWGGETLQSFRKPQGPQKRQGIVAVISNCNNGGASFRTAYLQELMQYISIDSYGGCLNNKKYPPWWEAEASHGKGQQQKIKLYKDYKFVIAFENNNSTDYVTEKLPTAILGGALPIFMGADNVDEWAPDSSVVKTSDFKNPQELAQYIKTLDQDDQKYQQYFKWKSSPLPAYFLKKYSNCVFTDFRCRLCQHVHRRKRVTQIAVASNPIPFNAYFDGFTEIRFPEHKNLHLTSKFSIALWIKPDDISREGQRLVDANLAGGIHGYNFDLFAESGASRFETFLRLCGGIHCYSGTHPIYPKIWTHVALTYDADARPTERKLTFYVNGKEDIVHPFIVPIFETKFDLVIGGPSRGEAVMFKGGMDNLFVFRRALSKKEIHSLMFLEDLSSRFNSEDIVLSMPFNIQPEGRMINETGPHNFQGKVIGRKLKWSASPPKSLIL